MAFYDKQSYRTHSNDRTAHQNSTISMNCRKRNHMHCSTQANNDSFSKSCDNIEGFLNSKQQNCENDPNTNFEIVGQTISCDKFVRPNLETDNDYIKMLFKQSAYYNIRPLNTEIVRTIAIRLDGIFFMHFNVRSLQTNFD